jgi:S1-C subfamily serine protease
VTGGRLGVIAVVLAAGAMGGSIALVAERATRGETAGPPALAATPPPASAPTSTIAANLPPGAFDARRIYEERAAGVVTISAVVAGGPVDGSGFVISAAGHVITNAHVVTNSPEPGIQGDEVRAGQDFYVHFHDGNSLPATLVGFDLFSDIAVLKVDPARQPLAPLSFGRSTTLRVGDPLAVIGSPFGREQEQSLSVGVVSALGREIEPPAVDFTTPGVIQTDAPINHGNSGGPVLDAGGRVVGVAAQIAVDGATDAGSGVGFAVPAEAAERALRELVAGGKVPYAWLGVATYPVTRELARQFDLPVDRGLLVNAVTPGGPSERAGLTAGRRTREFQDDGLVHPDGDIIVAFDGVQVRLPSDLSAAVALAEPGESVGVEIIRDGKRRTVQVRLGTRPRNLSR